MKKSKNIAFAGIFTALCVVSLMTGTIIQTLDLTSAAIGSLIILFAFIELGKKWALGVYAAASVIGLLILPYKSPAVVFALFAGFYPILKEKLNRITPKWLSYIARLICFNLALLLIGVVLIFILKTDAQNGYEGIAPTLIIAGMTILGNITFLMFDLALERISVYYIRKIRPKLFGK